MHFSAGMNQSQSSLMQSAQVQYLTVPAGYPVYGPAGLGHAAAGPGGAVATVPPSVQALDHIFSQFGTGNLLGVSNGPTHASSVTQGGPNPASTVTQGGVVGMAAQDTAPHAPVPVQQVHYPAAGTARLRPASENRILMDQLFQVMVDLDNGRNSEHETVVSRNDELEKQLITLQSKSANQAREIAYLKRENDRLKAIVMKAFQSQADFCAAMEGLSGSISVDDLQKAIDEHELRRGEATSAASSTGNGA